MSPKMFAVFMLLLKALLSVKSEDMITALVPIDRCYDSKSSNEIFWCKLDECNQWISFAKCPVNDLSTNELNMAERCLNCKNEKNDTKNSHQGLFPISMCKHYFTQEEIIRCNYEECWFSFTGCDEDEIATEYLDFKKGKLVCQGKESTLNPGKYIVPPPTAQQQTSKPHSGQESIQANVILMIILLLFGLKYYC